MPCRYIGRPGGQLRQVLEKMKPGAALVVDNYLPFSAENIHRLM
jgi:hypothetical protein